MKKNILKILISIIMMVSSVAFSNVKEYYINCNPQDFEDIYKNPYLDKYIPITLTYKGKTWDNLRMRIRGDDTRVHPKKSLKIKFDGEAFENGRDVLNFNAEYEDPTYICQYLSSLTFRKLGYPCFEAEHARLYLNGRFLGLYLRIENVDAAFLKSRNLDPTGNLYKATEDDASLSIYDDVNTLWEKKTNENLGREDLQKLIDSLFYVPDGEYERFAKTTFDYEKMVDIIAVNMLIAHGSTYYHNYFMYHDIFGSDNWIMMPWDMDKTFSMYGFLYPYHRSSSYTSPDNPFFERALLCEPIFNDIRNRITDLKNVFFNNEFYDPIIDSITAEIRESVAQDTTDNITDLAKWENNIRGVKNYIQERYNQLQYQFNNLPRSFKVEPTVGYYQDSVKFIWHPSVHPLGNKITYNFYFGTKENLDDTGTTSVVEGITDTFYIKKDLPSDGNYYWMVMATDGSNYIEGFNYPNPIKIKKATELPCTINSDMTLTKENSPYLLKCDLVINANLILEKGVTLKIHKDNKIIINGSLHLKGTKAEPVIIEPAIEGDAWDKITIQNGNFTAKNATIQDGIISGNNAQIDFDSVYIFKKFKDLTNIQTYFFITNGKVELKNCKMSSDTMCEFLVLYKLNYALTENCIVTNCFDGIEYMNIDSGMINNCKIFNVYDDAIDFNDCNNIIIRNNFINKAKDKGISIGNEEFGPSRNNFISNNIIINCETGIAVKDSSSAFIINNTLFNNITGINVYEKWAGFSGGYADIKNTIISSSLYPVKFDKYSIIKVNYSLNDSILLDGESNIFANPMFVDPVNMDFRLMPNSPCIDAGDPTSSLDPDGSRADIGALPFGVAYHDIPNIVINEINYNSATDFDTGDWVEFYNADSKDIDISGWFFTDNDISHKFIFPENSILKVGGYLVLCRESSKFKSLYPEVTNYLGDMTFGLSSDGEMIKLYSQDFVLIDSLIYGVTAPWATEANGYGSTLELISPDLDNTKPENWVASQKHGTPGKQNGKETDTNQNQNMISVFSYPNPAGESVVISIYSKIKTDFKIQFFNILGEKTGLVFTGYLNEGENLLSVNLKSMESGIYFYTIQLNGYSNIYKLEIIK
jgi:parallel beta-helix repeat protein